MSSFNKLANLHKVFFKKASGLEDYAGLAAPVGGAILGGGGTALYDYLRGNKENRLSRILKGTAAGTLGGAGLGVAKDFLDFYTGTPIPRRSPEYGRNTGIGAGILAGGSYGLATTLDDLKAENVKKKENTDTSNTPHDDKPDRQSKAPTSKKPSKKGPISKESSLNSRFFKQSEGIDPRVAAMQAQRDAIRKSLDVTGPGGGTTQGHVRSDGKGGWTVSPGAQYTPQKGYNQQGYKIPDPIPGAGGQANTPPVPYGKQAPPQPVDPRLEMIRKGTADFERRNDEFDAARGQNNIPSPRPAGKSPYAEIYEKEMAKRIAPPSGVNPQTPPMGKPNVPAVPPKVPAGGTYAPSRFPPK